MSKTANILRIERISINDGYGLRTVVFFKGCPLRCAWCSTPESQSLKPEVYYRAQKCISCGRCERACPNGAICLDSTGIIWSKERCDQCMACVQVCPNEAWSCYGKEMTVEQVMEQVHQDEIFFFHSGGGVTLSGGDLLCQAEFARDLLIECKESAFHTMAEMDMYGDYEKIAMLLPYLDAFYADIKMIDPVKHKQWTGVDNQSILANITRAASECRKNALHIRYPLVWGINDDRESIIQLIDFCKTLPNCAQVEFLPYHRLGQSTYAYLNRTYKLASLPTMKYEDAVEKVSFLNEFLLPFAVFISGRALADTVPHK